MNKENQELNELLNNNSSPRISKKSQSVDDWDEDESDPRVGNLTQWTTGDNIKYVPATHTKPKLPPGVYEIKYSTHMGIFFEKIPVITEGLLRFPQTNSDKILTEIQNFWTKEAVFKEYGLTYKRGVILWGPAGGGKTSVIQLIANDVVERGGIVIKFTSPGMFLEGMRDLRTIEPETPIVVLMEDIEATLQIYNESEVLNILDGIDQINKVVYLATTNFPEQLGHRIINRPSRFDKRFKIGNPNSQARRMYFEHLIKNHKELDINLDQWVKDTTGMSLAHLKELFVAVIILGDKYEDAVETLKSMKEVQISSDDDSDNYMGFGHKRGGEDE